MFVSAELCPVLYVDPMQPVNLLRKNWVLRKDMSEKMVNTRLSLWNALLTAGKDQWLSSMKKTYENVDGDRAEKFADLLLDGKLDESDEFQSYEDALLKKTEE